MVIKKKGMMFVLSSPSGAGKTTLTKKLAGSNRNFSISISHTTRKPRPDEVNKKDYYFVDEKEFKSLIKKNSFFEHARIFDNYYGTYKRTVDEIIKKNDVIFDIDWQGTKQLASFKNLNLVKIYLVPPNKEELKQRLIKRNLDPIKEVEKRYKAFDDDVKHWKDYDYILINENLDDCYKQIEKIILINKSTNVFQKI